MALVTGRQLADKALEQARHCLSGQIGELGELAAGDLDALRAAAELVRGTDVGRSAMERTVQHIAFSFLTAIFAQATEQSKVRALGTELAQE